jgi:hypothetical protein
MGLGHLAAQSLGKPRGDKMIRLSTQFLQHDDAMRSFYRSCGMSEQTIENALKARKKWPPEETDVKKKRGPRAKGT